MELELKEHDTLTVKLAFLESPISVRLLAAETNGLWINAEEMQGMLPESAADAIGIRGGAAATSKAVFVPFAQVQYVVKRLT
ncbi:MAG: hypothetical protein HY820_21635 [Acidobacteria bacterium]|nr:hypothetical protein [Acidobacteriota bacterium]